MPRAVLLALRWIDTGRRGVICERLRALPLPVFLLPDRFVNSILSQASWGSSAEFPVEIQRAPLSGEMVVKRIFDFILAALGLLILSLPAADLRWRSCWTPRGQYFSPTAERV